MTSPAGLRTQGTTRLVVFGPQGGTGSLKSGGSAPSVQNLPPDAGALLQEACRENVAGFRRAYTLTFVAAFMALCLGLLLPGWPLKWAGRRAADQPAGGH